MNKKERLELANWVAAEAKKSGANEVGVDVSYNREIQVEFRDGKIDQLKESTQSSLNLSVYVNSRYSSHWTNDMRKDALGKFIQEAVAMTKYLNQDLFRSLPDPKYYRDQKKIDLKVNDPSYEKVTSENRVKMAQEIQQVASAQSDKVISCTSGYSDTFYETTKLNGNGFEGNSEGTFFSAGAEITVKDERGGRPEDWERATVRLYKELPKPESLGEKAARRALSKIGQTKLESGLYDMIVENRTIERLFYSLYGPMQGRALQQKSSFLEGKLGQRIGSDKLTLIDDPFIPYGLGSSLFDGEGMASKRRVIIEKGILKSYFIDSYYGKKLGMEPTSGSSSNLILDCGTKFLDEMIGGMKRGILVSGFIGGNYNSTTGDFSYGIMGKYIENGEIIQPVNEMNITGNSMDLWNQLVEVGNDPYTYSSWRLPSLYFRDVQFSGI
jgi:PmbA protein